MEKTWEEKRIKSRKDIVNKAKELAVEYKAKNKVCGQCTFLAIVDTLG